MFRRSLSFLFLVFLAVVPAAGQGPASVPSSPELSLTFIDVGQGDAVYLRTPSGRHVLIDAGPRTVTADGKIEDAGRDRVVPFLREHGVERLDAVILTHSHPDHSGGLASVLGAVPVRAVYETGRNEGEAEYRESLRLVSEKGIGRKLVFAGDTLELDPGMRVDVLAPPAGKPFEKMNNNSLVLRLTFGERRFLLTADAEMEEEEWLVRRYGDDLRADVMKSPHHGSYSSSSEPFLSSVRPTVIVISCGRDNAFDHPHTSILSRYKRRKSRICRTDYQGDIALTTDGARLTVQPANKE